jgi:hypothetical protein
LIVDLASWLAKTGMSKAAFGRLLQERGLPGTRAYVCQLCQGQREPGVALIIAVEEITSGAVTLRNWPQAAARAA